MNLKLELEILINKIKNRFNYTNNNEIVFEDKTGEYKQ